MSKTEAYMESSRCLFCYDAPCMQACPTHIDIPLFIKQIHTGNVDGAAKTIFDSNWLGSACGKVCPTGVLCEGACVFTHDNAKPIDIGRLQYYATEKVIREDKKEKNKSKPVALIGKGVMFDSGGLNIKGGDFSDMKTDMAGSAIVYGTLKLLEPVMRVEVVTPEDYMGDVIGDLNSRRGQISTQEQRGNATVITAMVPLANMFGYINSLRSMSQGRAQYSMFFDHYSKVPQNVQDEVTKKIAG